jgi:hypothetical protein
MKKRPAYSRSGMAVCGSGAEVGHAGGCRGACRARWRPARIERHQRDFARRRSGPRQGRALAKGRRSWGISVGLIDLPPEIAAILAEFRYDLDFPYLETLSLESAKAIAAHGEVVQKSKKSKRTGRTGTISRNLPDGGKRKRDRQASGPLRSDLEGLTQHSQPPLAALGGDAPSPSGSLRRSSISHPRAFDAPPPVIVRSYPPAARLAAGI